ncbi:hypothetical protein G9A89_014666 [Geosiphon pyriformis]|nr:hypothetical protein G9A89_014666 [Geosiphon pyriformis]
MDMEAIVSSTISKKKALKGTFHGPAGDFFSQKKKVVFDNIKHSGNKRNISLGRFGFSVSIYSNVESFFRKDENVSMSGIDVNTGAVFGSPLGSSNFHINDNKVVFPPHLPIFLDKKDHSINVYFKKSMEMATLLVRKKGINVNSNLKRQGMRSD